VWARLRGGAVEAGNCAMGVAQLRLGRRRNTTKHKKGETHLVEWKESWRDEYLKWVCGFANADGGTLIIGVNDKGESVGAPDVDRLLVELPNKIRDTLGAAPASIEAATEVTTELTTEVTRLVAALSGEMSRRRRRDRDDDPRRAQQPLAEVPHRGSGQETPRRRTRRVEVSAFTVSVVERAALAWFEALGYTIIGGSRRR
jgi:hypothetical protein